MSKYVGAIYDELSEIQMIKDNFTVGQKLAQIEKTANKRFIDMSDLELYDAIQKMRKEDYYSDEKMSEEDFKNWSDAK